MFSDPIIIIAILVAFSLGGILKGATGAGAPIITIPVIAAFYDVRIESPKKVQKNMRFIVYIHKQNDAYIYENPIYMRLYNEPFNRINPNSLRFL